MIPLVYVPNCEPIIYNEWVPIAVSMAFLGMIPTICEYMIVCAQLRART